MFSAEGGKPNPPTNTAAITKPDVTAMHMQLCRSAGRKWTLVITLHHFQQRDTLRSALNTNYKWQVKMWITAEMTSNEMNADTLPWMLWFSPLSPLFLQSQPPSLDKMPHVRASQPETVSRAPTSWGSLSRHLCLYFQILPSAFRHMVHSTWVYDSVTGPGTLFQGFPKTPKNWWRKVD